MNGQKRFRVAIGVFDELDDLLKALVRCEQEGTWDASFVLAARTGTMVGKLEAGLGSGNFPYSSSRPPVFICKTNDPASIVSASAPGGDGPVAGRHAERIANFEQWIYPKMAKRLNRHLESGACLFFVVIPAPEQEQIVCRALIEHSVGQVQVHDFLL